MTFRSKQIISRNTAGAYVSGGFVEGITTSFQIDASVQPMTGEDMKALPSGKRISDYVKAYTDTALQVTGETLGLVGDRLTWRGHTYECIGVDVRQMGAINHYKYVFSRISQ